MPTRSRLFVLLPEIPSLNVSPARAAVGYSFGSNEYKFDSKSALRCGGGPGPPNQLGPDRMALRDVLLKPATLEPLGGWKHSDRLNGEQPIVATFLPKLPTSPEVTLPREDQRYKVATRVVKRNRTKLTLFFPALAARTREYSPSRHILPIQPSRWLYG